MNLLGNSNNKDDFYTLFKRVENDLYNYTKNKINNPCDVDDIMQEAVTKALKSFPNLRNRKYFKTWMISIISNECNKSYSYRQKETLLLEKIIARENLDLEDSSILELEEKLHFKDVVNAFPSPEQEIIILYYQLNYPIKEIAHALQINENTIKSKIKRNKEKLEKLMKGGSNENKK